MVWFKQTEFDVRFEWGLEGAKRLAPEADVTVVVDILCFSTCIDVAVSRGAEVFPYFFKDEKAKKYAESVRARCVSFKRTKTDLCLSPKTLEKLNAGDRIVLPSPNGSTVSFSVNSPTVLCGSIRNAAAVGLAASQLGTRILVIAAGEQWEEGKLRPCLEDLLGAGAILSEIKGSKSPEAECAIQSFYSFKDKLLTTLQQCSSGKELTEWGYPEDMEFAAALNISKTVPILKERSFTHRKSHSQ